MKKIIYMLMFAALALGIAGCAKEEGEDNKEPVYSSVLTPDFSFEDKIYVVRGDGVVVQFVNNSKAEGTEITGYFWHYGFFGANSNSEKETPDPVTYTEAGEYTVKLTIYGADGNKATAEKVINILSPGNPPAVSFTATPEAPNAGDEVTFTSTSIDTDGTIVSYKWTVAGVQAGTGDELKYTFTESGNYEVTLEATDDLDNTASATKDIYVMGSSSGSGTADDPWIVSTADEWLEMAADMGSETPATYRPDAHYVVVSDLDFTDRTFTRCPGNGGVFSGVLDGKGHKFTGISVDFTGTNNGVIAQNSGVVKNLVVEAEITSTGNQVGVVGKNMDGGLIENVSFEGTVSTAGNSVGGICGINNAGGLINGCTFLGGSVKSTLASNTYCGGVCGQNSGTVVNCGVKGGSVEAAHRYVGGVVGCNRSYVVNCYSWVLSCKSTGNNDVGGVVGGLEDGAVINCYSTCGTYSASNNKRAACAVGRVVVRGVKNVYGTGSPVVGQHNSEFAKGVFDAIDWGTVVTAENMKKNDFLTTLNGGITDYNSLEHETKPEGISLRVWISDPTTELPVLSE